MRSARAVAERFRLPGISVPSLLFGNQIGRIQMTIAVDHQPRYRAQHRGRVEDLRQRLGHSSRADVPCDVASEFCGRQTEIVELRRDVAAGVIAEDHESALALGPKDSLGFNSASLASR